MIAITGASGFVGSYIAEKLSYPQKRLTRQSALKKPNNPSHYWVTGDLQNTHTVNEFTKDSSTLIHLAWNSYPRTSNSNTENDIHQNLLPTIHLFESYAKANPGGHIIFSSTGGNMYDASLAGILHSENDPPLPQSTYGIHKLAAENYLRLFCQMHAISATILRISNPYGVLLPKQRPQGVIGVAFAKLLANEPLTIFDSMDSIRDYIHLDDLTSAFNLTIQQSPQIGECRVLNVSSGIGYSLSQVLNLIETTTGRPLDKNFSNQLPSPTTSILSYKKIKETLGWSPIITLRQGIQNMWNDHHAR